MFNANDLLGGLLQGGGPRGHSTGRLEHAMGERGLGGAGGPLGQILGGLGGGSRGGGYQGGGGILGGLAGMLGGGDRGGYGGGRSMGRDAMIGGLGALAASVLASRGSGLGGGTGGGGIGGVTSGVLAGLPGGRMRGAIGAGGLAVLGMLAMKALRDNQQPAPNPSVGVPADGPTPAVGADPWSGSAPPERTTSDHAANLVLRAMIEAAKADGRVDATERQRLVAKAQESGVDQEAAAFLQRELDRPADPDALAAEASRDPVIAAQIYAASLLAIQVDTEEERAYLRALAGKLRLEPAVVAQLHGALGAPPPA